MPTPRIRAWEESGTYETVLGERLYVHRTDGEGPLLVLLHGFPSCSYDWRALLELGLPRATLAFDFLGFGLSAKPANHRYSLRDQADLVCELVRASGEGEVFVLAHDMGTSVATELLARDLEGGLGFALEGVLLLNGSMVQDAASPTLGQRLLRGPLGPLASRVSSERFFRAQLGSVFSAAHPLSAEEAADQYALYTHAGGNRIAHRTIRYMDERKREAPRWHGALRDWPGRLSFAWALCDPVATPAVLEALLALRPAAPVLRWPELGHYPQIEDPAAVRAALEENLSA
ncbi:MAG TPA: alpha/beta hydrolase [Solirubrobacteraceae bacterium]|jgi:pimeloyl-ACP methyl ester carboxylesterase|nr:alpha/beta hydrolase [Solirubrobacteraceae bacterium]